MATLKTILGLGAVTLGTLVAASQTPQAPASQGLRPLAADAPLAPAQPTLSWRDALRQPDFEARSKAFDQAVQAVGQDATLEAALGEWAADKSQGELAWTAYLILHEARDASRDPMQQLFSQGFADPFGRGFSDPFEAFFGGRHPGLAPFGGLPMTPGAKVQEESQSYSLEWTADGVKVRVETKGPGGTTSEEYEAKDLDELRAAHPELFDANGQLGQAHKSMAPGQLLPVLPAVPGPGLMGQPRTDMLGVMVRPMTDDGSTVKGMRVERVLPHTIAQELGLEVGDTIVRIGERPVRGVEDIKAALAARGEGEALEVEWLDAQGNSTKNAWDPLVEKL